MRVTRSLFVVNTLFLKITGRFKKGTVVHFWSLGVNKIFVKIFSSAEFRDFQVQSSIPRFLPWKPKTESFADLWFLVYLNLSWFHIFLCTIHKKWHQNGAYWIQLAVSFIFIYWKCILVHLDFWWFCIFECTSAPSMM